MLTRRRRSQRPRSKFRGNINNNNNNNNNNDCCRGASTTTAGAETSLAGGHLGPRAPDPGGSQPAADAPVFDDNNIFIRTTPATGRQSDDYGDRTTL